MGGNVDDHRNESANIRKLALEHVDQLSVCISKLVAQLQARRKITFPEGNGPLMFHLVV